MLKQVRDRRAEAQLDKGMSQTKVKSCMYASKLLTERSPVAKCVMIAEADMDAAESFCAAPDGTGHRDMARSESSARELGRPVPAQAGGQESDGTVVALKRVMTVERRVPACMAFQTGTAERDWPIRSYYAKRRKTMYPESDYGRCCAPRSSLEETRGESRCGCAGALPWNHRSQVLMEDRLREEMRGRRQSRGRRAACRIGRTRGIRT